MVTLRNLCLAIKDQLPLPRLIRNLKKGHVLGLFHKRAHFVFSGAPKVSYRSKVSATRAAAAMSVKTGVYFCNYKCVFCDGYHIGRNRK